MNKKLLIFLDVLLVLVLMGLILFAVRLTLEDSAQDNTGTLPTTEPITTVHPTEESTVPTEVSIPTTEPPVSGDATTDPVTLPPETTEPAPTEETESFVTTEPSEAEPSVTETEPEESEHPETTELVPATGENQTPWA